MVRMHDVAFWEWLRFWQKTANLARFGVKFGVGDGLEIGANCGLSIIGARCGGVASVR